MRLVAAPNGLAISPECPEISREVQINPHNERASTILTSNRPVYDWGKLLGDTAAVTAHLDRLLHHAHVIICGPGSWRTKLQTAADRSPPLPR